MLLLEGPADARAHSSSRRGINVESRQQVLKDMWPGEKALPPAGYTTSSKIQLHNIYSPIPSVSGVCSCKEGRINLFLYDCLHGAPSSSLAAALSRPRRERTALCANFLCQRPKLLLMWTLLGAQPCDQSTWVKTTSVAGCFTWPAWGPGGGGTQHPGPSFRCCYTFVVSTVRCPQQPGSSIHGPHEFPISLLPLHVTRKS